MQFALEKYQADLVPCPICGKAVALAPVLEKRTGTVRLGITCARNCFPRDLYTCAQDDARASKLVRRWRTEIAPAIEKWKVLSRQSPRCPHCDKPTRLLPVPDKNGTLVMRPVCVQQGCRLPAQWHFSPIIWKPSEMAGRCGAGRGNGCSLCCGFPRSWSRKSTRSPASSRALSATHGGILSCSAPAILWARFCGPARSAQRPSVQRKRPPRPTKSGAARPQGSRFAVSTLLCAPSVIAHRARWRLRDPGSRSTTESPCLTVGTIQWPTSWSFAASATRPGTWPIRRCATS